MARQRGETTKQMTEAPQYAVFVWVHGDLEYPRDLARKLQREDLEIVSPFWLEHRRWIGLRLRGIVVDHAARLTAEQLRSLSDAQARIHLTPEEVL